MSSPEAKRCKRSEEVVDSRDKISSLPNDLLIRILLLVSTKDAVATMILSKRWRFIWTMVPKLEYKDAGGECGSIWKFHDKLFELHKAHVLEDLCIQLDKKRPSDVDVRKLVANAVDRFVRKLDLRLLWSPEPTSLPKSLYTCKTLVELTLSYEILINVPSLACLPSLKILRLIYVFFKDEDTLERLVSSCSVLAQSRVNLVITDWRHRFPVMKKFHSEFPHIFVMCCTNDKFLRAMSFVTSLLLLVQNPMALNFSGNTFSLLQHFVLHPLGHFWLDLLPLILNNSPKLRLLRISSGSSGYRPGYLPLSWNQPSHVPRCLSTHMEVFKWKDYRGNEVEKQFMRYILANSKCLKLVKITLTSTFNLEEKEMTEKELKSMPRLSTMSQLLFE